MRIVFFTHSIRSDWNHGNAHFLRGVAGALQRCGHVVDVYEPRDSWSANNLGGAHGEAALDRYLEFYPTLRARLYDLQTIDLARELESADLVLVHEWNEHALVARLGEYRRQHSSVRMLFHDTHHRSVTEPASMAAYDLSHYDGVLAFGESVRQQYRQHQWAREAWTWHEAADVRVFHPHPGIAKTGDLVWIGNWGDEERRRELREFLVEPVHTLHLRAQIYGVRYPDDALSELQQAGIEYKNWLPNFLAPQVFAAHRVTVHVPRGPYVAALPGVPTIRVFEALACGIPLVSAPWQDSEDLFHDGDYLKAKDGAEMREMLQFVLSKPEEAQAIAERGRNTVLSSHTCDHRAEELLAIASSLQAARQEVSA